MSNTHSQFTQVRNKIGLFILSLAFTSCNQAQEPKKEMAGAAQVKKKDTVAQVSKSSGSNLFNDISGILSGVDEPSNSLNYLYDSSAWKENKAFINSSWEKLNRNRLAPMAKWSGKELTAANANCKTVFYPFSGPDFLTSNAFFPDATELVMLGLEPVGSLPPISKFSNLAAKDYCDDFKHSLNDIFEKSYFITQYMLRDFQREKVNGLLPVLCFFIRKTGHQVLDIKYMVKYNNDSIYEKDYTTKDKPFGVKVTCEKDNIRKTIYYFRYDVSNKQFNDTCAFYKFINRHTKNSVTYVKSASYLLHANFMSNMKKLILTNSNYVLEDDTGIPYSYFQEGNKWNIKLYGEYGKPIKNFPYLKMQQGILDAYKKDSASIQKLPFHLGYHWQDNKDVLIYATKK